MSAANADLDVAALLARLHAMPRRITSDSRVVEPGVAFAAYPGTRQDGRAFIADAIARGAPAVLWEAAGWQWDPAHAVPNLPVEGLREKLGSIAAFIGHGTGLHAHRPRRLVRAGQRAHLVG